MVVRSGLWEVCVPTCTAWPCYWPSEARGRVVRATWFVQRFSRWLPLGLQLTDSLENAFAAQVWATRRTTQPGGLLAARVELRSPPGAHALFSSEFDAFLCTEAALGKLQHAVGLSGGDKGAPGLRLRRGWRDDNASPLGEAEAADAVAAATPITHLCLVTHGIGHRLEVVDVERDATLLRGAADALAKEHCASGRLMVLPVQWRQALDGRTERLLDNITPDVASLRPLRRVLNALVQDVLSYWTPTVQEMTDALTSALNAQAQRFGARNPGFTGKVSIVAHSLGAVLSFDILAHQPADPVACAWANAPPPAAAPPPPSDAGFPSFAMPPAPLGLPSFATPADAGLPSLAGLPTFGAAYGGADHQASALRAELAAARAEADALRSGGGGVGRVFRPLSFRCHALVMLGSPLALFQALQARNRRAPALQPPACARVLNVLHPHDPCAYRLEPLIAPSLAPPRPAMVPYHRNSGKRAGVELAERVEALQSSLRGMTALSSAALARMGLALRPEEPPPLTPREPGEDAAPRALLRQLAGAGPDVPDEQVRLDFQLQSAELDVPLLSAITAHTSYHGNPDVALLALRAFGMAPEVSPLACAPPL